MEVPIKLLGRRFEIVAAPLERSQPNKRDSADGGFRAIQSAATAAISYLI